MVPVDDLHAGMVLSEDVHDAQGRLLMPRGTALTDRHLRAFRLWGILGVRIRGDEAEDTGSRPAISATILAEAERQVRHRLRHNQLDQPLIAELLGAAILRLARRLQAEESHHG
jgi:hypothetical protein